MNLRVKRIYDAPEAVDGARVLVDRLWPRGLSKEAARVDLWLKEAAPSTALRTWYHAQRDDRGEFIRRYTMELETNGHTLAPLGPLLRSGTVTLLYSANTDFSNAHVLRDYLIAHPL